MELSDFSSLIEVAVTLNVAFVAIEYVKSYTTLLCNQVFKLQDYIKDSFDECLTILVDEETLEHIEPRAVGRGNTQLLIERAKREREKIKKNIENEKSSFNNRILNVCEAKNVSSISLWLFFYGLVALFLFGLKNIDQTHTFWGILSVCTLIYSVIGWLTNNRAKHIFFDFSSLRHTIIWFVLALIFCCVLEYFSFCWLDCIMSSIWNIIIFVSIVMMYSNFVASVLKVWSKADSIKTEIKMSSNKIKENCTKLKADVDKLINVNDVASQLEAEA